jgi:hypothetical protein
MWVEWNDAVHARVAAESGSAGEGDPAAIGRRAGALIRASPDGRVAAIRTFWTVDNPANRSGVTLSPVETLVDLDGNCEVGMDPLAMFYGRQAHVSDAENGPLATLLDHVRFRFDNAWADYYRAAAQSEACRRSVANASLAAVARDAPFLLAFLLLHSARDATHVLPVSRDLVNRKRRRRGEPALLDHIEVHASLGTISRFDAESGPERRNSPRLHHVRGHLVRRNSSVFWRTSHLRGSSARGVVQSRTVHLSFGGDRESRSL